MATEPNRLRDNHGARSQADAVTAEAPSRPLDTGSDRELDGLLRRLGAGLRLGFLTSTMVLLLVTGLGKVLGLIQFSTHPGLVVDPPDPLLPFLRTSWMAMAAVVLELGCALALWRLRRSGQAFLLLSWLVGLILCYRLMAWFGGADMSKGCGAWVYRRVG